MEAQLIDTAREPHLPRPAARILPEELLEARIDAYLRAAGVTQAARRGRLATAVRGVLAARATTGDLNAASPSWAEIIAAVDCSLAAELSEEAIASPEKSVRGRVALRLDPVTVLNGAWSRPPRQPRRMRPQSLSLWRPQLPTDAAWLSRFQVSRSSQGLAACLCWLAVLIIP